MSRPSAVQSIPEKDLYKKLHVFENRKVENRVAFYSFPRRLRNDVQPSLVTEGDKQDIDGHCNSGRHDY